MLSLVYQLFIFFCNKSCPSSVYIEKISIMKKLLLSMALLMACTFATAQRSVGTWSLIPKVGVNLANISNFDVVIGGLYPDGQQWQAAYRIVF